MGWLETLVEVFVGTRCAGCERPALALCPDCAALVRPQPRVVRQAPVRVAAAGDYDGVLRSAVVAWKERGRFGLELPLAHLLAASILTIDAGSPVTLVPIPARPAQRRARGADVLADLARRSAKLLSSLGVEARVAASLTVARAVRDQAELSARDRLANMRGAFAVRRQPHGNVVLVDDIVTTGATLDEAVRVLATAGTVVAGAAVLAQTPDPLARGLPRV